MDWAAILLLTAAVWVAPADGLGGAATIGLSVAIPVLMVGLLILVVTLCYYCRRRPNNGSASDLGKGEYVTADTDDKDGLGREMKDMSGPSSDSGQLFEVKVDAQGDLPRANVKTKAGGTLKTNGDFETEALLGGEDISTPNISSPKASVGVTVDGTNTSDIEAGANIKTSSPDITLPKANGEFILENENDSNQKAVGITASVPVLSGGVDKPTGKIDGVEINTSGGDASLDLDANSSADLKPLSTGIKDGVNSNIHADVDVSAPDTNLSINTASASVETPSFDGGDAIIQEASTPLLKASLPEKPESASIKPTKNVSGRASIDGAIEVEAPQIKGTAKQKDIKSPKAGKLKSFGGKFKNRCSCLSPSGSTESLVGGTVGEPKLEGGNVLVTTPDLPSGKVDSSVEAGVKPPGVGIEVKYPKGELETDIEIDKPKLKGGKVTTPELPSGKVDSSLDAGIKPQEIGIGVKYPKGDLETDNELKGIVSGEPGSVSVNLDGTDGASLNAPDANVGIAVPGASVSIDGESTSPKITAGGPNMDLSGKVELETPDMNLEHPSGSLNMPSEKDALLGKADVIVPQRSADVNVQAPQVNVTAEPNTPNKALKVPKGGKKRPFGGKLKNKCSCLSPSGSTESLVDATIDSPNVTLDGGNVSVASPELPSGKVDSTLDAGIKPQDDGIEIKYPKGDLETGVKLKGSLSGEPGSASVTLDGIDGASLNKPETNVGVSIPGASLSIDGEPTPPGITAGRPNMDLSGDVKVESPEITIDGPNMDLSGDVKVESPEITLDQPSGTLDIPSEKDALLGKPDVIVPETSADVNMQAPKLDVTVKPNVPNKDLKAPKKGKMRPFGGKFKNKCSCLSPSGSTQSLVDATVEEPKLDSGKISMTTPELPSGKVDTSLDAGIKQHEAGIEVKFPKGDLETDAKLGGSVSGEPKSASVNLDGMGGGSFDTPQPNVGVAVPDASIAIDGKPTSPEITAGGPNMDLSGDVKVESPDITLDQPSGTLDIPSETDALLGKADIIVPQTSADVNVQAPQIDITAEPKAPNKDLKAPKAGKMKSFGGKFKNKCSCLSPSGSTQSLNVEPIDEPKLEGGKVSVKSPDLPSGEVDASIDASIQPPKVGTEVKIPKGDLETDAKLEGSVSGEPKSASVNLDGMGGGSFDTPQTNVGVAVPGASLSIDGKPTSPEITVGGPNMDLSGDVKVESPDITLDQPSGTLDIPSETDALLGKADVIVPQTSADVNVQAPQIDITAEPKAPNKDLKAPKAGKMKSFGGKFKNKCSCLSPSGSTQSLNVEPIDEPKLEGGKISVKSPDLPSGEVDASIDASIQPPKVGTEVKIPKGDLETDVKLGGSVSGEPNSASVNLDGMGGGSFDTPQTNVGVAVPGASLSIDGKPTSPEITAGGPNMDLSGDVKIESPEITLDQPSGTLDIPNEKDALLGKPDVIVPETSADVNMQAPKMDVNAPNKDLKAPKKGKMRPFGGKFKNKCSCLSPSGSTQSLNGNISVASPELPSGQIDTSVDAGIKPQEVGIEVNYPKGELETDIEMDKPKLESGKVTTPELPSGTIDTSLDTGMKPQAVGIEVKYPKGDFEAGAKLEGGVSGEPKIDSINLDGMGGPSVDTPETNVAIRVPGASQSTDGEFASPEIPGMKLESPVMELNQPSVTIDTPSEKDALLGEAEIIAPQPSADVNVQAPKVDITSTPNAPNKDLKAPKAGKMRSFGGKFKNCSCLSPSGSTNSLNVEALDEPKLQGGKASVTAPELPSGKVDTSLDANLKPQEAEIEVKYPKGDLETDARLGGNMAVETASASVNLDGMKGASLRTPETNVAVAVPDASISIDGASTFPEINTDGLNMELHSDVKLETPEVTLDQPSANFDMPSEKDALLGGETDVIVPKISADVNAQAPEVGITAEANAPNKDLKTPKTGKMRSFGGKFKNCSCLSPSGSTQSLPGATVDGPKLEGGKVAVTSPELPSGKVDASLEPQQVGIGVEVPKGDLETGAKVEGGVSVGPKSASVNIQKTEGPTIDIPEANVTMPTVGASMSVDGQSTSPELAGSTPGIGSFGGDVSINSELKTDQPSIDLDMTNEKDALLGEAEAITPEISTNVDLQAPSISVNAENNVPNIGDIEADTRKAKQSSKKLPFGGKLKNKCGLCIAPSGSTQSLEYGKVDIQTNGRLDEGKTKELSIAGKDPKLAVSNDSQVPSTGYMSFDGDIDVSIEDQIIPNKNALNAMTPDITVDTNVTIDKDVPTAGGITIGSNDFPKGNVTGDWTGLDIPGMNVGIDVDAPTGTGNVNGLDFSPSGDIELPKGSKTFDISENSIDGMFGLTGSSTLDTGNLDLSMKANAPSIGDVDPKISTGDITIPSVSATGPSIGLGGSSGTGGIGSFGLSHSGDINLPGGVADIPSSGLGMGGKIDVSGSPSLDSPKLPSSQSVTIPSTDINTSDISGAGGLSIGSSAFPKGNLTGDWSGPGVPGVNAGIDVNAPTVAGKVPGLDIPQSGDIELSGGSRGFGFGDSSANGTFGITGSSTLKTGDLDISTEVNAPSIGDVDPKISTGDITIPSLSATGPSIGIGGSSGTGGIGSFGLSHSGDINLPGGTADIPSSGLGMGGKIDISGIPSLNSPELPSSQSVTIPSTDINTSGISGTEGLSIGSSELPKGDLTGDWSGPGVPGVNAGIDVNAPTVTGKVPGLDMPQSGDIELSGGSKGVGFGGSSVNGINGSTGSPTSGFGISVGANAPSIGDVDPKISTGDVTIPSVSASGPSIGIGGSSGTGGIGSFDLLHSGDINLPAGTADIPSSGLGMGGNVDVSGSPSLGSPKLPSSQSVTIPSTDINTSGISGAGGLSIGSSDLPKGDLTGDWSGPGVPGVNAGIDVNAPTVTGKVPGLDIPQSGDIELSGGSRGFGFGDSSANGTFGITGSPTLKTGDLDISTEVNAPSIGDVDPKISTGDITIPSVSATGPSIGLGVSSETGGIGSFDLSHSSDINLPGGTADIPSSGLGMGGNVDVSGSPSLGSPKLPSSQSVTIPSTDVNTSDISGTGGLSIGSSDLPKGELTGDWSGPGVPGVNAGIDVNAPTVTGKVPGLDIPQSGDIELPGGSIGFGFGDSSANGTFGLTGSPKLKTGDLDISTDVDSKTSPKGLGNLDFDKGRDSFSSPSASMKLPEHDMSGNIGISKGSPKGAIQARTPSAEIDVGERSPTKFLSDESHGELDMDELPDADAQVDIKGKRRNKKKRKSFTGKIKSAVVKIGDKIKGSIHSSQESGPEVNVDINQGINVDANLATENTLKASTDVTVPSITDPLKDETNANVGLSAGIAVITPSADISTGDINVSMDNNAPDALGVAMKSNGKVPGLDIPQSGDIELSGRSRGFGLGGSSVNDISGSTGSPTSGFGISVGTNEPSIGDVDPKISTGDITIPSVSASGPSIGIGGSSGTGGIGSFGLSHSGDINLPGGTADIPSSELGMGGKVDVSGSPSLDTPQLPSSQSVTIPSTDINTSDISGAGGLSIGSSDLPKGELTGDWSGPGVPGVNAGIDVNAPTVTGKVPGLDIPQSGDIELSGGSRGFGFGDSSANGTFGITGSPTLKTGDLDISTEVNAPSIGDVDPKISTGDITIPSLSATGSSIGIGGSSGTGGIGSFGLSHSGDINLPGGTADIPSSGLGMGGKIDVSGSPSLDSPKLPSRQSVTIPSTDINTSGISGAGGLSIGSSDFPKGDLTGDWSGPGVPGVNAGIDVSAPTVTGKVPGLDIPQSGDIELPGGSRGFGFSGSSTNGTFGLTGSPTLKTGDLDISTEVNAPSIGDVDPKISTGDIKIPSVSATGPSIGIGGSSGTGGIGSFDLSHSGDINLPAGTADIPSSGLGMGGKIDVSGSPSLGSPELPSSQSVTIPSTDINTSDISGTGGLSIGSSDRPKGELTGDWSGPGVPGVNAGIDVNAPTVTGKVPGLDIPQSGDIELSGGSKGVGFGGSSVNGINGSTGSPTSGFGISVGANAPSIGDVDPKISTGDVTIPSVSASGPSIGIGGSSGTGGIGSFDLSHSGDINLPGGTADIPSSELGMGWKVDVSGSPSLGSPQLPSSQSVTIPSTDINTSGISGAGGLSIGSSDLPKGELTGDLTGPGVPGVNAGIDVDAPTVTGKVPGLDISQSGDIELTGGSRGFGFGDSSANGTFGLTGSPTLKTGDLDISTEVNAPSIGDVDPKISTGDITMPSVSATGPSIGIGGSSGTGGIGSFGLSHSSDINLPGGTADIPSSGLGMGGKIDVSGSPSLDSPELPSSQSVTIPSTDINTSDISGAGGLSVGSSDLPKGDLTGDLTGPGVPGVNAGIDVNAPTVTGKVPGLDISQSGDIEMPGGSRGFGFGDSSANSINGLTGSPTSDFGISVGASAPGIGDVDPKISTGDITIPSVSASGPSIDIGGSSGVGGISSFDMSPAGNIAFSKSEGNIDFPHKLDGGDIDIKGIPSLDDTELSAGLAVGAPTTGISPGGMNISMGKQLPDAGDFSMDSNAQGTIDVDTTKPSLPGVDFSVDNDVAKGIGNVDITQPGSIGLSGGSVNIGFPGKENDDKEVNSGSASFGLPSIQRDNIPSAGGLGKSLDADIGIDGKIDVTEKPSLDTSEGMIDSNIIEASASVNLFSMPEQTLNKTIDISGPSADISASTDSPSISMDVDSKTSPKGLGNLDFDKGEDSISSPSASMKLPEHDMSGNIGISIGSPKGAIQARTPSAEIDVGERSPTKFLSDESHGELDMDELPDADAQVDIKGKRRNKKKRKSFTGKIKSAVVKIGDKIKGSMHSSQESGPEEIVDINQGINVDANLTTENALKASKDVTVPSITDPLKDEINANVGLSAGIAVITPSADISTGDINVSMDNNAPDALGVAMKSNDLPNGTLTDDIAVPMAPGVSFSVDKGSPSGQTELRVPKVDTALNVDTTTGIAKAGNIDIIPDANIQLSTENEGLEFPKPSIEMNMDSTGKHSLDTPEEIIINESIEASASANLCSTPKHTLHTPSTISGPAIDLDANIDTTKIAANIDTKPYAEGTLELNQGKDHNFPNSPDSSSKQSENDIEGSGAISIGGALDVKSDHDPSTILISTESDGVERIPSKLLSDESHGEADMEEIPEASVSGKVDSKGKRRTKKRKKSFTGKIKSAVVKLGDKIKGSTSPSQEDSPSLNVEAGPNIDTDANANLGLGAIDRKEITIEGPQPSKLDSVPAQSTDQSNSDVGGEGISANVKEVIEIHEQFIADSTQSDHVKSTGIESDLQNQKLGFDVNEGKGIAVEDYMPESVDASVSATMPSLEQTSTSNVNIRMGGSLLTSLSPTDETSENTQLASNANDGENDKKDEKPIDVIVVPGSVALSVVPSDGKSSDTESDDFVSCEDTIEPVETETTETVLLPASDQTLSFGASHDNKLSVGGGGGAGISLTTETGDDTQASGGEKDDQNEEKQKKEDKEEEEEESLSFFGKIKAAIGDVKDNIFE